MARYRVGPRRGSGVFALESAIELARCLRDIGDLPAALAKYESLRRPRQRDRAPHRGTP